MERPITAILLMLSLQAGLLVAAGRLTAAVADGVDVILLPSDGEGLADGALAATRPWKCCDRTVCTRSFPPTCRCLDTVKHCAGACKECEASKSDPSRRVCHDQYHGDPGPRCTKDGGGDDDVPDGVADHQVMAAAVTEAGKKKGDGEEKSKRPWKCCDLALCTRSIPPICFCRDKVERCAGACKQCVEEESADTSRRYMCMDAYRGDPGPRCTPEDVAAAGGN